MTTFIWLSHRRTPILNGNYCGNVLIARSICGFLRIIFSLMELTAINTDLLVSFKKGILPPILYPSIPTLIDIRWVITSVMLTLTLHSTTQSHTHTHFLSLVYFLWIWFLEECHFLYILLFIDYSVPIMNSCVNIIKHFTIWDYAVEAFISIV